MLDLKKAPREVTGGVRIAVARIAVASLGTPTCEIPPSFSCCGVLLALARTGPALKQSSLLLPVVMSTVGVFSYFRPMFLLKTTHFHTGGKGNAMG